MMQLLLALANIVMLYVLAYWNFKSVPSNLRRFYWPALLLKLLAGALLGVIYLYYYVGDTFEFHHDAQILTAVARRSIGEYMSALVSSSPINDSITPEPRTLFFVKVVSVFHLITCDNYWITGCWFSFFSFMAAWRLVVSISYFLPAVTTPAVISFLFFPSCVFWTSGIIKESLAGAGLFVLATTCIRLYFLQRPTVVQWLVTAVACFVSWTLKYYWVAVFLLFVVPVLLDRIVLQRRLEVSAMWNRMLIMGVTLTAVVLIITRLHPNFYLHRFLAVLVENYETYAAAGDRALNLHYPDLQPSWYSVVVHTPMALFNALFRPLVLEVNEWLPALAAVENFVLLLLFLTALPRLRSAVRGKHSMLVVGLLGYIILLAVFLALSTPNFGSLARYRVGFLPFFVMLLLCDNVLVAKLLRRFRF